MRDLTTTHRPPDMDRLPDMHTRPGRLLDIRPHRDMARLLDIRPHRDMARLLDIRRRRDMARPRKCAPARVSPAGACVTAAARNSTPTVMSSGGKRVSRLDRLARSTRDLLNIVEANR